MTLARNTQPVFSRLRLRGGTLNWSQALVLVGGSAEFGELAWSVGVHGNFRSKSSW